MIYTDAYDAIKAGAQRAPCGISYIQGQGWKVYDLTIGAGGNKPEFLFLRRTTLPIALSEEGEIILKQFFKKLCTPC